MSLRTRLSQTPRLLAAAMLLVAVLAGPGTVPAAAAVDQVVVVFKTHFDIGYTDMASNVVQRYRTTMIDDALKVVDQNRDLPPDQQFVWTLAGWPLAKILEDWPGQTPERQRRVREAFKQGRFVVHALPFTTHTELLELEDLVRGLGYSSRLCREAGLPLPRDAKMTDVPSHSWILPTLLRHAGVDFLHLGCNAASSSPRVPRLFWWEGPDGSRLLTMYTAESYGTGLVPPADWPYKTWLALIHTGDNHGPPRPEEVKALLDEAKTKLPGVKVRIGRLSDFADGIFAQKADIPVVRGDMPDTWIHGPMSDPGGANLARTVRPEIAMGEALNTLLSGWGLEAGSAARTVARAYENSLLYGEHTWGGAYWWIYGKYLAYYGDRWKAERRDGRFARIESSWAEHTAYIDTAAAFARPGLASQLATLARGVAVEGRRLTVFNPLPWRRDGLVKAGSLQAVRAVDGGEVIPVSSGGNLLPATFLARDVPALGYRTYVPAEPPAPAVALTCDAAGGIVDTPHFRAVFDTNRFVLRSLRDKQRGRELVNSHARPGFGEFVYERFSSNAVAAFVKAYVKIDADWATNELGKPMLPPTDPGAVPGPAPTPPVEFRQAGGRVDVVAGPARELSLVSGRPGVLLGRFTFYADQPCIDVSLLVLKPVEPWPEAGWIALPFAVDAPRFQLGRLGSILDPAKDIVAGANRHLLALNTGLTVSEASGWGVGLCSDNAPLVSLGEPGCWRYSIDDFPREATVYLNAFNNQWTTNFRIWNEGTAAVDFRIWSFAPGVPPEASLTTPSLETRFPLQMAFADGPAGKLPATAPGLELSRRGVQVTALGTNPDGAGTVLRLWELSGQSGDCQVTLPAGLKVASVQPVDLRGRPVGAVLPVKEGRFTVAVKAFAPASFVLER